MQKNIHFKFPQAVALPSFMVDCDKPSVCGILFFMSRKQPLSEIVGVKFGLLTILEEAYTKNPKHRRVKAICECGTVKNYFLGNLKRGLSISCGCYNNTVARERLANGLWVKRIPKIVHGYIRHSLYGVWAGMKDRCYNPNCKAFHFYGGGGAIVCEEWRNNFKSFYDWAISNGWQKGLEIDKDIKGNGKLYSPETCCFVTEKENCNKRRSSKYLTLHGETKTVSQWSDIVGLSQQVIYKRTKRGWSVEKALETPLMNNQFTFKYKTC